MSARYRSERLRHGVDGFDADGRLVVQAVDLEQAHWFGGRAVPLYEPPQ